MKLYDVILILVIIIFIGIVLYILFYIITNEPICLKNPLMYFENLNNITCYCVPKY